jgi:hypothetical protein
MTPKTIRTARDKTLYVYQLGEGRGSFTFITSSPLPDFQRLQDTYILVEEGALPDLKHYLANTLVEDAVKETGLGQATVSRARKALGVEKKYSGSSLVTQWRRKKRLVEDEELSID